MTSPSFSEEKLTAYALGELSPAERREIETEIASHPELQAELKVIQDLAAQLREELSSEATDFETADFSDRPLFEKGNVNAQGGMGIGSQPDSDKIISFRKNPWLYGTGLLAAAACALLMFLPSLSIPINADKKTITELPKEAATDGILEGDDSASLSAAKDGTPMEMPIEPEEQPPSSVPMQTFAVNSELTSADRDTAPSNPIITSGLSITAAAPQASPAPTAESKPIAGKLFTDVTKSESASNTKKTVNLFGSSALDSSESLNKNLPSKTGTSSSLADASTAQPSTPSSSITTRSGQSEVVAGYFVPAGAGTGTLSADLLKGKESLQISRQRQSAGGESYAEITDNAFLRVSDQALSTFSIDVDTAAYSNLRRFLNQGQFPPKNAVRIEELINYFNYNYPQPQTEDPFSVTTEVAKAPWKDSHLLVRIGLQGKTVAPKDRPAANLVFLIDVSGSMDEPNKLPLVIDSMKLLVQKLKPEDRVGIAVYAGNSGMVLPSTPVSDRGEILKALSHLSAGGSTNGAMGIQLAYDMAKAHFIEGGINRVILCTDGDFNVGITDHGDLLKLIEEKAKSKVFLSVFGFGMGNLQDATLEQLADKGNGNYGYIDTAKEAKRTFVDKLDGTLQTIAKDVKIQVEFNPAVVSSYRLIGYENRMLAAEDFNNDKKDAGEIGSGHRVTALYEIVPVGVKEEQASIDPLKYQKPASVEYAGDKSEIMNVKLRYKQPEGEVSKLIEHPVKNESIRGFISEKGSWWRSAPDLASDDFQFAAGVAAFGMILRDSPYKGDADLEMVLRLAAKGSVDKQEDRVEFIGLVKKARKLLGEESKSAE